MNNKKLSSSGFSLIEVILAVALFGLFATAFIGMLLVTSGSSLQAKEKDQAVLYAKQGIDAVLSIRRQGWNMLSNGSFGVTKENGFWELKVETDTLDEIYNRTILINEVCRDINNDFTECDQPGAEIDPYVKKVIVQVQYQALNGITNSVRLETYITNWQSINWVQNNWTGGPSQEIWSNTAAFSASDGNLDYSNSFQLKLKQQSGIKINQWSLSAEDQYSFDDSSIEISDGAARLKPIGQINNAESANPGFNNLSGWSFHLWDVDPTDPTPAGARVGSAGNPGSYYRITIPRSANRQLGAWVQREIVITEENIESAYVSFDEAVILKNSPAPVSFKVYAFVDQTGGIEPVVGSEVWSSGELAASGVSGWTPINIDLSSVISGPGTYYLKLAVLVESGPANMGVIRVGFDNAKIGWSFAAEGYSSDSPSIQPVTAFNANEISAWNSFSEQAVKNGGEIFYQLSADGGDSWLYWNGGAWTSAGVGQFNNAFQVNNAIKFFPIDSESILFKAFLVSDGSYSVALSKVTVSYATEEGSYWGNEFIVDQFVESETIDNSNKKLSFRFTASENKTVNQIRLFQSTMSGASVRVGIQADDGNGFPSGTYLGSRVDSSIANNAWRAFSITPNVNLMAGQIYHIVIQQQAAGAISKNYRAILPHHNFTPYASLSDNRLNILSSDDGGSTWIEQNQTPIFILSHTDSTYKGIGYHVTLSNNANWSLVYGNRWRAQTFVYQGDEPLDVYGAAVYVRRTNPEQPADDLYVVLYDNTNNVEVASTTAIYASDVTDNFSWKTVNFPKSALLQSGNTYSLRISSPGATTQSAYDFLLMQNTNNEIYNNVNFQSTGGMFLRSNNAGGSWSSAGYLDMPFRLIHYGSSEGYAPAGWAESSAFSTGANSSFNALSFQADIPACNPACEVRLQIRTAPDNAGSPGAWTDWFGSAGASTYFTSQGINILPREINFNRWVQYRAELIGDGDNTPVLENVLINYTP
jgi:prepilin-type N-terminal cleavage/methylation domain-containing protein